MLKNKICITLFLLLIYSSVFLGQDSTNTYNLNQITVESKITIEPKPTTILDSTQINFSDAISLFQIAKYIPSVKAQTNSRGESLFYLRGSNERQLGLFFDGNFLNIPWDNRIDLSLLPTSNISSLTVIKGVPSSIYGANNISGVILAESETVNNTNLIGKINTTFGANNYKKLSFSLKQKIDNFAFLISTSFFNRDAFSLPSDFESLSNPTNTRVNSDQRTIGLFGKGSYYYNSLSSVSVSVNYLDSEKGVPPEIDVEKPRLWKYPLWQKFSVALFGKHSFNLSNSSFVEYGFNLYNFRMQINQYNDVKYSSIKQIEKDTDFVITGRIIYTSLINKNSLIRLSANGFSTSHNESFLTTDYKVTEYQQLLYSAGAEYELLKNNFTFIGGISLDGTSVLKSGNFASGNPLLDYGINATLKYKFSDKFNGQVNVGKKSRFPSLRESYSDGLGRFVRNPELRAENVIDAELSLQYSRDNSGYFVNFLYMLLNDGIVRTVVATENGNKFMRINKGSIRTYGVEFESNYRLNDNINSGFSFSFLNSFGKNNAGEFSDTLEYRPNFYTNFFLSVKFLESFNFLTEANSISNEYSLKDGNPYFQKLPSYIVFNLRISYTVYYNNNKTFTIFLRTNNLFDKLYYTQFGLPESGREVIGGIKILF